MFCIVTEYSDKWQLQQFGLAKVASFLILKAKSSMFWLSKKSIPCFFLIQRGFDVGCSAMTTSK